MGKVRMGIRALAAEGKWEEKQAKYSSIRVFTTMECMAKCLQKISQHVFNALCVADFFYETLQKLSFIPKNIKIQAVVSK